MYSRRELLAAALAAPLAAAPAPDWGGNVIDIHHHPRRGDDGNLRHMKGAGVSHALFLGRATDDEAMRAEIAKHPGRFQRFVSADVGKPEGIGILRKAVETGAIGFGEIKLHLGVESPEMKRLYDLAAELGVPVLIHFAEVEQFPGEGTFAMPFHRLPAVLAAHKRTTFIGHADGFWGNICAKGQQGTPYPTGKVQRGGLSDKMLGDYPNLYGDLSANSGRNALARDPEFAADFLKRHRNKLMFGSDCSCADGMGEGQRSKQPLIAGKCVARETLAALKQLTSPALFKQLTFENASKLLKFKPA